MILFYSNLKLQMGVPPVCVCLYQYLFRVLLGLCLVVCVYQAFIRTQKPTEIYLSLKSMY